MSKVIETIEENGHRTMGGYRMYELNYRRGSRPPEAIVFEYAGNHQEAIDRGRKHCEKMDFRFLGVYPFCVDLDAVEKHREKEINA